MSEASPAPTTFSIGQCATLACLLEATAPKPGNVHRGADFAEMSYFDFLASGVAIGPILERAASERLGTTVLRAIEATRAVTRVNTNLGIVLLLAPLAAAGSDDLAAGVNRVLANCDAGDARDLYRAIRLAQPGGMGRVAEGDVAAEPTIGLVEAMGLARERDRIARQYVENFSDVWRIAEWLAEETAGRCLAGAIVRTQLRVLAEMPDSLIMRKCGAEVAREASDRAAHALSLGAAGDEAYEESLAEFDFWLRADGQRRNPGTTADLLTAALFVLLRRGTLRGPFSFYTMEA